MKYDETIKEKAAGLKDPCDYPELAGKCVEGGTNVEILSLAQDIITYLLIGIGILSVVFIIISAIQIATAGGFFDDKGKQTKVKKAQYTLIYAIIGLVVAVLASVIVQIVFSAIGQFK